MPMTNWKKQSARVVALLVLGVLAGCHRTGSGATDPPDWYCEAFRPISWSSMDSEETILQVTGHNAVWVSLCRDRPGR